MKKVKLRKRRPRIFEVYPDEVIFNEWFEENIHRFNHKPLLQEKGDGYVAYGFEGIIGNITLNISFGSPEASLGFTNLLEFCDDEDGTYYDIMHWMGKVSSHKGIL